MWFVESAFTSDWSSITATAEGSVSSSCNKRKKHINHTSKIIGGHPSGCCRCAKVWSFMSMFTQVNYKLASSYISRCQKMCRSLSVWPIHKNFNLGCVTSHVSTRGYIRMQKWLSKLNFCIGLHYFDIYILQSDNLQRSCQNGWTDWADFWLIRDKTYMSSTATLKVIVTFKLCGLVWHGSSETESNAPLSTGKYPYPCGIRTPM